MINQVPFVPFLRSNLELPERWLPYLKDSYNEGRFSNFGPLYRRLCIALEEKYAVNGYKVLLSSNATSGLTAVLQGLNIRGAVAIPSFTFPATLHAVLSAGCEPVLCDVDPKTWEISPDTLAPIVERRQLAAIVPVRCFGFVRNWTSLYDWASHHQVHVVADAAASLGAISGEAKIGSALGHTEVVSLHATKVFRVGEGGAIFLPSDIAPRVERAMNFGLATQSSFGDGANAKIDELRCAIGLSAMVTIDDVVARRRQLADRYRRIFERFPDLATTATDPGPAPWQCYPARFASAQKRWAVESQLNAAGIASRRYYAPSITEGYSGNRIIDRGTPCPTSEALAAEMLCLPLYEQMSDEVENFLFEKLPLVLENVRYNN